MVSTRRLVRERQITHSRKPSIGERVGGEKLARKRKTEVLLRCLQHETRVVEHGNGRYLDRQSGGCKPTLPQLALAEQRLARECFGRRAVKAPRRRRRCDDDQSHRLVEFEQPLRF